MKQEMVLNLQEMDKTVVLPEGANSHSDLSKASRVEQIYQDFCTRRDAGEAVDPDEFLNRFPSLKGSLQRLLHAHLYLEENSFLLADSVPGRFPSVGESFLGFHLLQELGKGTFARVFLARESKLGNRLVAVKIVKSLHGGVEAKILGQIKHNVGVSTLALFRRANEGAIHPYLGGRVSLPVGSEVGSGRKQLSAGTRPRYRGDARR